MFLYPLNKKLKAEHVFIYNVTRVSSSIYLELILRKVKVEGFVTDKQSDHTEYYCGVPILGIDSVKAEDSVVVYSEDIDMNRVKSISDNILCSSELYEKKPDESIKGNNIYIYGAGKASKKLALELWENDFIITGFLTSDGYQNKDHCLGLKVKKFTAEDLNENDVVIIPAMKHGYIAEIIRGLDDVPCKVLFERLWNFGDICASNLPNLIDAAMKTDKSMLYIGSCDFFAIYIKEAIELTGISFKRYVQDPFDADDEDPNNSIAVVWEIDDSKRALLIEKLNCLGYSVSRLNLVGIQPCTVSKKYLIGEVYHIKDALAGTSLKYVESDNGWTIIGNPSNSDRIIILGGSTSTDEIFSPESWGRKLYRLMNNWCIFVGAVPGYNCVHELLRLFRDGINIKPTYVISMSGVNDLYFSYKNRFNLSNKIYALDNKEQDTDPCTGINGDETPYDFWKRTEQIMKTYSESIGARFIPIIQPMNKIMDDMTLEERFFFEEDFQTNGMKDFLEKSKNDRDVVNLIDIFHHKKGMFIDSCHYSDQGNDKIAQCVYRLIIANGEIDNEG